jgi:hypothetical protein
MHTALLLFAYWALAFFTLGMAVMLLNIYFALIGNDLQLRSLGEEAAIAGVASLVEGTSVWLFISFVPTAARGMIIPAMVVALIYKLAHLEDWSRFDVLILLTFQVVIGCIGVSLLFCHFQTAIVTLVGFALVLGIIAGIARSF